MGDLSSVPFWQFLAVVLVQAGAMIWWASNINRRVGDLESDNNAIDAMTEKAIKTEGKVELLQSQHTDFKMEINRRLDRIEQKLDKAIDGPASFHLTP